MNWRAIRAVVSKDFTLFFRNRFFAVITVLGLVTYMIIYFVMPSSVDETLEIGLYAPVVPPSLELIQKGDGGLRIEDVESEAGLREAVSGGQYIAGIVLPADIMEKFELNEPPDIVVYFPSDIPDEIRDVINGLITEIAYLETGQVLNIDWQPEILGPDMAGQQIPQRDRLRSLFAIFVLMTETFSLASLISDESERGTARALLVTPMTVKDLFTAKAILGTIMALGQAVLLLAIVGGISEQPLIILMALFLGAVLVTGVAFLIASLARDFLSIIAWSIPALVVFIIPAFGIMIPGGISDWIKVIPSYYFTDTIYQVSSLGAGWGDIWGNLTILAGFDAAILAGGIMALRRKYQ
ncbi:MAG: ABC transporter permease [Dehalococcoidia bacterium]|nr:MAG: ABC transporter permease [Dehalococcoidia bacterium]